MTEYVQFHDCSRCGSDWETKVDLPFWTREKIIENREVTNKIFGDHHCHRCTVRDILISLKTGAGKPADDETIEAKLKELGW